jgi:hypothetical protein
MLTEERIRDCGTVTEKICSELSQSDCWDRFNSSIERQKQMCQRSTKCRFGNRLHGVRLRNVEWPRSDTTQRNKVCAATESGTEISRYRADVGSRADVKDGAHEWLLWMALVPRGDLKARYLNRTWCKLHDLPRTRTLIGAHTVCALR